MTDAAFLSSALAGPERRLRLVEGDGVVEDAGPGPRDPGPQGGGHVAAVLTGEAGGPVCALKEAVHALCPVFLLDVDQGLEFAQVMGVAGAVAHALEGELGGVIVMDEDAFEVLFDIAASRADAQDGQEWGAQHVEPAGTGGDPQAGFVEVLDRDGTAVRITSATWARKGSKRLAVRRAMAVIVAVEMDTAKRSLMSSAKRFSGTNWAYSR